MRKLPRPQAEVELHHPAGALALHPHHLAEVEGQQALQAVDLLPSLRDVVGGALQPHHLHQVGEDGTLAVEALQGVEDALVERFGLGLENGPGATQQLQAPVQPLLLAEVLVEHLQQEAGPLFLTLAHHRPGDAHEVVEVSRILGQLAQPAVFDGVEIALFQQLPKLACNGHGGQTLADRRPAY
jgi:hypothetical protein